MSDSGLSGPNSPAAIASMKEEIDEYKWNGLTLEGPPFGLEKIYDYEYGGHHPIHLGDRLGKDGRYRVIHKLGNGGFANIWLCRDLECETAKYVGLKILMADASTDDSWELLANKLKKIGLDRDVGGKYICLPLDQFQIDGPNGLHFCFFYPVLGPRVSCVLKEFEDLDKDLRKIALQVVHGMACLHNHGIYHGGFIPSNILLGISSLDGLTDEQVIQAVGEPILQKVVTESGESPTEPTAPRYLVHPVDFYKVGSRFVTNQVSIIDFGESFEASNPPDDLGIPQAYRSPELVLDRVAGIGSDLWALGCTLFEIRTGRKLFDTYDDDVDDNLHCVALLLGKFPEPWWTTWEARKDSFEDEADPQGRAIMSRPAMEGVIQLPNPRSIQQTLARGLWYADMYPRLEEEIHRDIPQDEIKIFADLLSKILKYYPSDRLTADAAQDHEWFKM